ncbi:mitochondrial protein [Dentipellis sp. KUC8613]|nr:mitochondrial protein [Dentipellis sp. KUC8613]
MNAAVQKILVVGGNGFIGSAICKGALARGFQVTSISSSGRPFRTPKGHTPAWTSKVDWQKADALRPETYAHLLPGVSAVVHTLGTLLEDTSYKDALRTGNVGAAMGSFVNSVMGGSGNPLKRGGEGSYELLNRDAALRVAETFFESKPTIPVEGPRPFVFISAEDIFRPFIPARYIETKREAEIAIENMLVDKPTYRGVYIRPSLVYHPHFRPYTSPIAVLLDFSAVMHSKVPAGVPTPSGVLRSLSQTLSAGASPSSPISTSPLESVANAMVLPPIHVDHVAEAACIAANTARADVRGVYGVREMRELIGWAFKGQEASVQSHV